MRLGTKAEEGWDAAMGLAADLTCEVVELDLEGGNLATGIAMWMVECVLGEAEAMAGIVDAAHVVAMAAVAREEAGVVARAFEVL